MSSSNRYDFLNPNQSLGGMVTIDEPRPEQFNMPIQGGMLEALGINMYTTLGKCLVEFVANAYDSEASKVEITIPFDRVAEERAKVRAKAKEEVEAGKRDKFSVLLETLPDDVVVTIEDDGHGMSWKDIRDKFLPLNRKRREGTAGEETEIKSESGKRFVMGRKGLGKLAGFGAAETVRITSKRRGETFATTIELNDDALKTAANVNDVPIPAMYEEGLDPDLHGTTIVLARLKTDAVKQNADVLRATISEAFFGIRDEDFSIRLNTDNVVSAQEPYALIYPEDLKPGEFATRSFDVEDVGEVTFRYFVGFREKSLPARKRGARIYCNNRLAAGPSLFNLPTGMHSFHSSDYMECVVEADELDRAGIDFINTNRSQLREDTEVVRRLLEEVTATMKEAIPAHSRYRDRKAEEDLKEDKVGSLLASIVETLPRRTREGAHKLLKVVAREFAVDSEEFQELAPVIMTSINATEVLVNLVHLRTNPETIRKVAHHLVELGEIERSDALKLYRARRNGIAAIKALWDKGLEQWGKKGIEKEFHNLLKDNPWLIRPEFSNYLTSDVDLNKVVSVVARELAIDEYAVITDGASTDDRRPDLVFLMSDPTLQGPFVINVVELKSPTLALNILHHRQLEDYIYQVEDWVSKHLPHTTSVRGYLIGAMPKAAASAASQKQLLERYEAQGALSRIRIVGIDELMRDAWTVHVEAIKALESEEAEELSPQTNAIPPTAETKKA